MYAVFLKNGKKLSVAQVGDIDFLHPDERINILFICLKQIEKNYIWNDEHKFWCVMHEGRIEVFYSAFFKEWVSIRRLPHNAPIELTPKQV